MFQNCTGNGYSISCFESLGRVNPIECGEICNLKNRHQFRVKDFYHYYEQLNQSKFLNAARDHFMYTYVTGN